MENTDTTQGDNAHRDPITAAPGAHPVVDGDYWRDNYNSRPPKLALSTRGGNFG